MRLLLLTVVLSKYITVTTVTVIYVMVLLTIVVIVYSLPAMSLLFCSHPIPNPTTPPPLFSGSSGWPSTIN